MTNRPNRVVLMREETTDSIRFLLLLLLFQNSSLHHENTLLKKNICALIKTAKMEIVRKDEEISNLSRR